MAEFIFTSEQKKAWDFIERRRIKFAERMARVADPDWGGIDDTCSCCGYPFLYFTRDDRHPCPVCTWDPEYDDNAPEDVHVALNLDEKPFLTLAEARLNFTRRGNCFVESTICFGDTEAKEWTFNYRLELRALLAALDALKADTNPANDEKHWKAIRNTFNALARLAFSDYEWNVIGMQSWKFAAKIDCS